MTDIPHDRSDAGSVNADLTCDRGPQRSAIDQCPAPSQRRRGSVENDDFARFAARVIRAHARRIAGGDVEGLADLLNLAFEVDAATQVAVDGLRQAGYSWGEIASRLGVSRQAAQQRWR